MRGTLASAHGRLRKDLENAADLAGVIARGEDPLVLDAHLPEHLAEVGAAVLDAHGGNDVRLGLPHVPHQHRHGLGRGTPRVLVGAVGDDECHRTSTVFPDILESPYI